MNEDRRTQTGLEVKLDFIIKEIDEIKMKLENKYVSQDEFQPIKNIVYGMVAIILSTSIIALLTLIYKK